jgi:hypothetical protein
MIRAACLRIDITPQESIDLSGGPFGKSRGVLDPLEASILLLEVEGEWLCWVCVDTIYLPSAWTDPLRGEIAELLDCPTRNIHISATHTHSGAAFMSLREWGSPDLRYVGRVHNRIVNGAKDLPDRLWPVRARFGRSSIPGLVENRRTPQGPVDDRLSILFLQDLEGRPVALLAHFTCHPITLWGYANRFSADFPGYLRTKLSRLYWDCPVMFINGAAGNINPMGFSPEGACLQFRNRIGNGLFRASRMAVENSQPIDLAPLTVSERFETVELDPPLDPGVLKEELESVENRLKSATAEESVALLRKRSWAADLLQAMEEGNLATTETLDLSAIRLGDLALLTLPGDPYVEIGLALEEMSGAPHTLVAGFTNGMVGYLCTENWQSANGFQEKYIGYRLLSMPKETERVILRAGRSLLREVGAERKPAGAVCD